MAASGAGLFTAGLFLSGLVRAGLGSAARGLFKMEPLRLGLASTVQVQLLSSDTSLRGECNTTKQTWVVVTNTSLHYMRNELLVSIAFIMVYSL